MTELATRPNDYPREMFASPFEGTVERFAPPVQIGKAERLREWLDLFIKTEAVANVLAKTTFVPKAMQGKPAEVAAAMMRGFEMGVEPLDALGHMHVINGKVGYSAEFMRRRIIEAGHEILFPETTDIRAVLKARRREHRDDESKWQTFTFTDENARKAKIDLGQYPADKLVARASSRMCRRMFPEVLAGADIAEDLVDAVVLEGGDLSNVELDTAPVVGRSSGTTVQRRRQPRTVKTKPVEPKTVDDDLLDDEPEPEPVVEIEPEQPALPPAESAITNPNDITKAQLQKLSILRKREGFPDDDEGRAGWFDLVLSLINREVSSNKELTKSEASVIIDVLENTDPVTEPEVTE